jgi:hypothetical protein
MDDLMFFVGSVMAIYSLQSGVVSLKCEEKCTSPQSPTKHDFHDQPQLTAQALAKEEDEDSDGKMTRNDSGTMNYLHQCKC